MARATNDRDLIAVPVAANKSRASKNFLLKLSSGKMRNDFLSA
jgi:hypothetical protein